MSDFGEGPSHTIDTEKNAGNVRLQSPREDIKIKSEQFLRQPSVESSFAFHDRQISCPKSKQNGFKPSLPPSAEELAVQHLQDAKRLQQTLQKHGSRLDLPAGNDDDTVEIHLSDFAIYRTDDRLHAFELSGLQHLNIRIGFSTLLFEGILSIGDLRHYVKDVPFRLRSIGNYGEDIPHVGNAVWIQSDLNAKSEIFYLLGTPSPEYARFYDEFLWLADLAKHFVDYCQASQGTVSINNFRSDFYSWLHSKYGELPDFRDWYRKYNKNDFRSAVSVNIEFLYIESMGIDQELQSHQIWKEILIKSFIPKQLLEEENTIVTQYVYDCFKDMRFGQCLKVPDVARLEPLTRKIELVKTTNDAQHPAAEVPVPISTPQDILRDTVIFQRNSTQSAAARKKMLKSIRFGDVLAVTKDGQGSVWKDEGNRWKAADDCWYVLVLAVHTSRSGEQDFDAIWLYRASDTACAKMKYPYPNELFMSDNCTCLQSRITTDEVLKIVRVRWHGQPSAADDSYFIRQTYLENERFVTLTDRHKKCVHLRTSKKDASETFPPKYAVGTTVLVAPQRKSKHALEPYEIVEYATDNSRNMAVLRRLRRRHDIDGCGAKNELVYTEQIEKVPVEKLQRTCLVRFFGGSEVVDGTIPPPYSRNGTGNAFYITSRLIKVNGVQSLQSFGNNAPKSLLQGFNPSAAPPRDVLHGLDLFCGAGNFGRGLEEGGAVQNKWAVDMDKCAIHSYYANLDDPKSTKLFCGSVNDMLSQAMNNNPKKSDLIPGKGDVGFISAGSPCQGFSNLNRQKMNATGLRNQSLVASVAAYIDYYRPKYGLLENVMTMAQKGLGRDEDVLSQFLCCLVGLGYQVQLFVLDAWSCGSSQSRSRLFVSFAAPGLEPLEHPALSHSHPPNKGFRALGKLANGKAFGHRIHAPTAFQWTPAVEVASDLPDIGNGLTYQCTGVPEHIMSVPTKKTERERISAMPTSPRGLNMAKAWNDGNGVMTPEQWTVFEPIHNSKGKKFDIFRPHSTAYGRVHPNSTFPTICCKISANESRQGSVLHWDQNRTLTIMECRRAQGMPDDMVLVGSPSMRMKLVGNSVDRAVALSLGLTLREAWIKNQSRAYSTPVPTECDVVLASRAPVNGARMSQFGTASHERVQSGSDLSNPNETAVPNRSRQLSSTSDVPQALSETVTKPTPNNNTQDVHGGPADPCHPLGTKRRVRRSTGKVVLSEQIPESSEDEGNLSDGTFRRFLAALPLRAEMLRERSRQAEEIAAGSSIVQGGSTSLKRSHGVFQGPQVSSPGKSYRVPRASSSSIPPANESSDRITVGIVATSTAQAINESPDASALIKKLKQVAAARFRKAEPGYVPDNEESDEDIPYHQVTAGREDAGSDLEVISNSPSLFVRSEFDANAVQIPNFVQNHTLVQAGAYGSEQPGPVVISLISDDEDDEPRLPNRPAHTPLHSGNDNGNRPRPTCRSAKLSAHFRAQKQLQSNAATHSSGQDREVSNIQPVSEEDTAYDVVMKLEDGTEVKRNGGVSAGIGEGEGDEDGAYKPVDNTLFMAYLKTNRYLELDRGRIRARNVKAS